MRFHDRDEAGRRLADVLRRRYTPGGVIYGLSGGGVVVGAAVARCLGLPLECIVARTIAHPQHPARAVAAVTESGDPVFSRTDLAGVEAEWLSRRIDGARHEARRCGRLYGCGRAAVVAAGRLAIVVDDATGAPLPAIAALRALRTQRARRVVFAAPVAARATLDALALEADEALALCLAGDTRDLPADCYEHFPEVTDDEVTELLRACRDPDPDPDAGRDAPARTL